MSGERSEQGVNMAPIDDIGPIVGVPDRIAICAEHGWWFEAKPGERCPQAGCRATVHHYSYAIAISGDRLRDAGTQP